MVRVRECGISVGRALTGPLVKLDLISEAHAIVTGQTRSGKSVWSYSFLSQLATEPFVRVVGVDLTGILLGPFQQRGLSDPWIVTDGGDLDAVLVFMRQLVEEMNRRNRLLSDIGADKLAEFSAGFPLIVAVFEEFPGIVQRLRAADAAETDRKKPKKAPVFLSLLSSLVAESAKAGIRLVLIAQRADADIIGGAARENIPLRVTFRQSSGEAYRMLYPDIEPGEIETVKAQPPGVAMIETPRIPRTVFKGPYLDYGRYRAHVLSCDLEFLLNLDRMGEFHTVVSEEFPELYGNHED